MDDSMEDKLRHIAHELTGDLERTVAELQATDDTYLALTFYQMAVQQSLKTPFASLFAGFHRHISGIEDEKTRRTVVYWYWKTIEKYKSQDGALPAGQKPDVDELSAKLSAKLKHALSDVDWYRQVPKKLPTTPAADQPVTSDQTASEKLKTAPTDTDANKDATNARAAAPPVGMSAHPLNLDKSTGDQVHGPATGTSDLNPQQSSQVPQAIKDAGNPSAKDNVEPDDDEPPASMLGSNAWIADEHDYPRSDLDTLRRQAWVDLRGLEAAYISRHRNAAMRITGKMASAMTSTFFGPKWMGGCAKRIIDIATKGPAIDIATRARQAVADHSNPIPDDFRTAFRAIGALMKSEQNDATFALDAYLDLVTLANTLKRIYSKMGTGDEELRLYAFGNASHSGKTRRQCLTEARKKLFTVCRITERQLIKLKEYSLLPQAAIENFGKGGLLFLPTSRDPARQLWGMRSGVASIMKSIKRSGQGSGDWLTVVAQRIKVEIVDRIENGEILGWDQGIVETLTPDMPILTILDKLRDSRSPREQVIKSETEDTDIHGMGGSFEDDEMHDA